MCVFCQSGWFAVVLLLGGFLVAAIVMYANYRHVLKWYRDCEGGYCRNGYDRTTIVNQISIEEKRDDE